MLSARRLEVPLGDENFDPSAPNKETIRWEEPNNRFYTQVIQPTLCIHYPSGQGPWPVVLICPGGGYTGVSLDKEGHHFATWLAARGIAGAVLKYRLPSLPPLPIPEPIEDVLRACDLLARDPQLAKQALVFAGFSAGGHLAGISGMRWKEWAREKYDALPSPKGLALIYPVVSMRRELAHTGSRKRLVGEDCALQELYSIESAIGPTSPPAFIVHSEDDPTVPICHSELLTEICEKHGVPVEFHSFPSGGHGFGLGSDSSPLGQWPTRMEKWLRALVSGKLS